MAAHRGERMARTSMNNIVDWWVNFLEHPSFWNAFWPAVWGAVIGAVSAFTLERRHRERERISREVGQCSRLIFTLGQMLNVLADLNELLFVGPQGRLGREPEWHEIGALPGSPEAGPGFVIGEFDFLLDDRDTKSSIPQVLSRVYIAASRFSSALALLHERNRLFGQFAMLQGSTAFTIGTEAVPALMEKELVSSRIEQLTKMLSEDLPEAVERLESVVAELGVALSSRYPGREFISVWRDEPN